MSTNISQTAKATLVINEKDLERKATSIQGFIKSKSLKDSRFGEVFVYNNNALHQSLICKEKQINSKEEAFKELQCLSNRMAMNNSSLQRLVDYSCTLQTSLCAKSFLILAFYEVPETDLGKEQQNMTKELKTFSEEELIKVYEQVHEGMKVYHLKEITHGEISPLMIGRRQETHEYILLDRLRDLNNDPLKVQTTLLTSKQRLFMSPELYEKLKGKQRNLLIDYKKNDHFCFGMTLLSLFTGSTLQECYQINGEFDHSKLQEILTSMKKTCKCPKLAYKIEHHLNNNSELRMAYMEKQGIQQPSEPCEKNNIIYDEANANYFECDNEQKNCREGATPGKTTVTYYQNGQVYYPKYQTEQTDANAQQDQTNQVEGVQYYYSQYNPNYQGYQPKQSYTVVRQDQATGYKAFYDQSTNDQSGNVDTQTNLQNGNYIAQQPVTQSTIIRRSYSNIQQPTDEYVSEWTTDEQGRKVEIRRYKPGFRPNGMPAENNTYVPHQSKIIRRSYVSQYQPPVVQQQNVDVVSQNPGSKVTYYSSYEEYLQAKQKEREEQQNQYLNEQQQTYSQENQDAYNYYQQQYYQILLRLQFQQLMQNSSGEFLKLKKAKEAQKQLIESQKRRLSQLTFAKVQLSKSVNAINKVQQQMNLLQVKRNNLKKQEKMVKKEKKKQSRKIVRNRKLINLIKTEHQAINEANIEKQIKIKDECQQKEKQLHEQIIQRRSRDFKQKKEQFEKTFQSKLMSQKAIQQYNNGKQELIKQRILQEKIIIENKIQKEKERLDKIQNQFQEQEKTLEQSKMIQKEIIGQFKQLLQKNSKK